LDPVKNGVKVVVFTTSSEASCQKVIKELEKYNIEYTEVDLLRDPVAVYLSKMPFFRSYFSKFLIFDQISDF